MPYPLSGRLPHDGGIRHRTLARQRHMPNRIRNMFGVSSPCRGTYPRRRLGAAPEAMRGSGILSEPGTSVSVAVNIFLCAVIRDVDMSFEMKISDRGVYAATPYGGGSNGKVRKLCDMLI